MGFANESAAATMPVAHQDTLDAPHTPHDHHRIRSLSLSQQWRRSRSVIFGHDHARMLSANTNDVAIDDSELHESSSSSRPHGPTHSLKGVLRRASQSIKGIVHRRTSFAAGDKIAPSDRPSTATGSWDKLRKATSFRRSHTGYGFDFSHHPGCMGGQQSLHHSHIPIPALGDEPPFIPANTGAAAKASVNEYWARYGLQQNRLHPTKSEDGNDRESGIGIVVSGPNADTDIDDEDDEMALAMAKSANISKVDFVSELPAELAIHVLACLDGVALSTARLVCKEWDHVISNQHIWRESCLRETTNTYATSEPVLPNTGLGIPPIRTNQDWQQVYQIKTELGRRWRQGKARPTYLNGHGDSVYCLQFDEHKIISGSRDRTIRIWDMHTLECKLIIGPQEVVDETNVWTDEEGQALHYATTGADNDKLACSNPKTACFDEHHKASILCLQYDDEILVTGSSDSTAIVYDIKNDYKPIMRLRQHTAAVLNLCFDKTHIVTCSKDTSICVWDRATGRLIRQLHGHAGPVNAVQMRGNTIVSCSGDFLVKMWNIDTGKNIREFAGHTKGLACSQFSEDGRFVASAGNDKVIRIWDANTGECVREMRAHENLVRSLHIDSVSGRLISASYDTDIKVWDMETGHQLLDFPRWHASWVLSAKSDYRRIVSTGQDPKILIMDFGADIEGIQNLESTEK